MELTQADLAEEAEMYYSYIGALESGVRNPSPDLVARLARAMEMDLGVLLEGLQDFPGRSGWPYRAFVWSSARDLLRVRGRQSAALRNNISRIGVQALARDVRPNAPWNHGGVTILIDTVVSVEPPIQATREVAGKEYRIRLSTGPATIVLPVEARNGVPDRSAVPSVWPTFPGKGLPPVLRPIGYRVSSSARLLPSPEQLDIEAMRCRLIMDESVTDPTSFGAPTTIGNAVGQWLQRAREWIGAWNGMPQSDLTRRLHPYMDGIFRKDGEWVRIGIGSGEMPTFIPSQPLVRPPELLGAFDAASAGIELPLQHRMWSTARMHLILADHRSCAIDACCAAEVALSNAVIETMKRDRGLSDRKAKDFVVSAHGVVDVFRLYLAARGSALSEGQVKGQLAGPRNRAAHEGDVLTKSEAEAALRTARELIAEATPLQTLSQIRKQARSALR